MKMLKNILSSLKLKSIATSNSDDEDVFDYPDPPHPHLKWGVPFGCTSYSGWKWLWDGHRFYERFDKTWIEHSPSFLALDKVPVASDEMLTEWLAQLREQIRG